MKHLRQRQTGETFDARQLRTLVNPVRQAIVDALRGSGANSVAGIARELGLSADVVNYHVKKLRAGNIVVQAGTRGRGRKAERVFRLAHAHLKAPFDPSDETALKLLTRAIRSLLTLAHKDFSAACTLDSAVIEGPKRNLHASRMTAWLTEAEWQEANQLIEKLTGVLRRSARREDTPQKLYAVTLVTAPVNVQPIRRDG